MATYPEQSDYVLASLEDRGSKADSGLRKTYELVENVRTAIATAIASLTALGITVDVSGVDTTYVASAVTAPTLPTVSDVTISITPVDTGYDPATTAAPTLPDETISITVTGVDTTYVAPTAAAATVPSASAVAIGDTEWDRILNRAAAEQTRVSVAEEQLATSEAAMRGLAVPAIIAAGLLSVAQQRTSDRISSNAEISEIKHAEAAREDIIKLTQLGIENYTAQWKEHIDSEATRVQYESLELKKQVDPVVAEAEYAAKVGSLYLESFVQQWKTQAESELTRLKFAELELKQQLEPADQNAKNLIALGGLGVQNYGDQTRANAAAEQTRLGYEELELKKQLEPEQLRANYDLKKTELATANAVGQLVDLVQVYAQLTNGLFSASDVSLSSGTNYSVGYPFKYNPDAGDVVTYTLE